MHCNSKKFWSHICHTIVGSKMTSLDPSKVKFHFGCRTLYVLRFYTAIIKLSCKNVVMSQYCKHQRNFFHAWGKIDMIFRKYRLFSSLKNVTKGKTLMTCFPCIDHGVNSIELKNNAKSTSILFCYFKLVCLEIQSNSVIMNTTG